jgi:hypothetical protein
MTSATKCTRCKRVILLRGWSVTGRAVVHKACHVKAR